MLFLLCAFASAPPVADPLPPGAIARLGTTRFRHGFVTNAITFSPDGRTLASAGNGRGLCLWDAATGELRHHCNTRRFPAVYAVAFTADGRRVVCAESPNLVLWDVQTGKQLRTFEGHTNGVIAAAASPGGWVASGSHDRTVRVWDPDTGAVRHVLEGFGATPWALAARPRGNDLAVGSLDGEVSVWAADSGMRRWRVAGHTGNISAVAYSPDGETLASAGADGTLRLWRTDGTPGRVVTLGERRVRSLAFTRSFLAASFDDATIRLYNPETGRELRTWLGGAFAANALAFSPDGRTLASGSVFRSRIDLWDVATGEPVHAVNGHGGTVDFLRFAGDTLLSANRNRELLTWDLKTKTARASKLPGLTPSLASIALSLDGRFAAVSSYRERTVRVVDLPACTVRHEFRTERMVGMAFGPGGRLAALDEKGELYVWDAASGKRLLSVKKGLGVPGRGRFFGAIAFAPDGERIAVSDERGTVRFVATKDGAVVGRYEAGRELWDVSFAPDSRLVAMCGGYAEPFVQLWDSRSGTVVRTWRSDQAGIYSVRFSRDGRLLATAGDDTDSRVHVWEARTGQLVREFRGHHSAVIPVEFAPDGRTLVSGAGDSTVLIWDLTAGLTATPEECWAALAEDNAGKAHRAAWTLAARPREAVALLDRKLQPVRPMEAKRLKDVLERLSADDFATRTKAETELRTFGPGVGPALEKAMPDQPLEARRRIGRLLRGWRESAEALREDRAVMALQQMGEAGRPLLTRLAEGAAGAELTEAARRALRKE